MNPQNPADSQKITLAFQMLSQMMTPSEGDGSTSATDPFLPPLPLSTKKISATDLLSNWFRPSSSIADPWDDYFSPSTLAGGAPQSTNRNTGSMPNTAQLMGQLLQSMQGQSPPAPAQAAPVPTNDNTMPFMTMQNLLAEPVQEIADEHAEAAVMCLYDFIHAVGRRQIDVALEYVAGDYHVFQDEHEVDLLGLRHQIETLLDSLRDWELDVSLLQIPEPVFHSAGILIKTNIQVHAIRMEDGMRRLIDIACIAVLEQQQNHEWKIAALSPYPN